MSISTEALGYIGAAVSVAMWGSNYVVTKKVPTADGFAFAWCLTCGIMAVGFVTLAFQSQFTFVPIGLIAGLLWAIGNILVIPIIKLVGLGIGFLLWSGANLVGGYIVGKIGLFGIEKEVIQGTGKQVMNYVGISLCVVCLLLTFLIKPKAPEKEEGEGAEGRSAYERADGESASTAQYGQGGYQNLDARATSPPLEQPSVVRAANVVPHRAAIKKEAVAASLSPPNKVGEEVEGPGLGTSPIQAVATVSPPVSITAPPAAEGNTINVSALSYTTDSDTASESMADLFIMQNNLTQRQSFLDDDEMNYILHNSSHVVGSKYYGQKRNVRFAEQEKPSKSAGSEHKSMFAKLGLQPGRLLGIALGLLAGVMYSVQMVPFKLWQQQMKEMKKQVGTLDFAFSQISGIWLSTSLFFLVYILYKRNKPVIPPTMVLPSMISGVMWACALAGCYYAVNGLGFTVGYPTTSIGPTLVSSFWNTIVFREISGARNLIILGISLLFGIAGVILLGFSH